MKDYRAGLTFIVSFIISETVHGALLDVIDGLFLVVAHCFLFLMWINQKRLVSRGPTTRDLCFFIPIALMLFVVPFPRIVLSARPWIKVISSVLLVVPCYLVWYVWKLWVQTRSAR
ncbi:hypothetical protein B0H13DRAFT_1941615 [Mycena leptocephala]|nr:hypothetical protein B0H13DRAFT_1941615 [Mycena leptocephala]